MVCWSLEARWSLVKWLLQMMVMVCLCVAAWEMLTLGELTADWRMLGQWPGYTAAVSAALR